MTADLCRFCGHADHDDRPCRACRPWAGNCANGPNGETIEPLPPLPFAVSVWLVANGPGGRLGRVRLRRTFPDAILRDIVADIGQPGYIVHASRSRVPVLHVRARSGGDLRHLVDALHLRARVAGLTLALFDATEPAAAALAAQPKETAT